MKPYIISILSILFILVIAGISFAYFISYTPPEPAQFALVYDRSLSSGKTGCQSVLGIANEMFHSPSAANGSKLFFFATGSLKTALEPEIIGSYDIPVQTRVMEGKGLIVQKQEAMLKGIQATCNALTRAWRSPILLAVSRAIEQLKSEGCNPNRDCTLYISSDGVETEERWFLNAIKKATNLKPDQKNSLDAEHINIHFCGFANVSVKNGTVKRRVKDTIHLTSLWKSVFKNPKSITFAPICPTLDIKEGGK